MASTSLPTPTGGGSGVSSNRYCFDIAVFGEEAFDPATFVTAAKEGASLEVCPYIHIRTQPLDRHSTGSVTKSIFHKPTQVLRDHLRGYQKDLRDELYEVINRDLADYLKLSSKVRTYVSGRMMNGCVHASDREMSNVSID